MANINETIANVEKLDPELARQIRKYVRDHAYGLVFEHNLPESVRLYTKKAAVGDTVNIRPARGEKEKAENCLLSASSIILICSSSERNRLRVSC